ncbi:DUF3237 family protein [Yinghuangia aomiensis]
MTADPARPGLDLLARFRIHVDPIQNLGETPWGEPPRGAGRGRQLRRGRGCPARSCAGGGDWQVIRADGAAADIGTRYTLRTKDDALVHHHHRAAARPGRGPRPGGPRRGRRSRRVLLPAGAAVRDRRRALRVAQHDPRDRLGDEDAKPSCTTPYAVSWRLLPRRGSARS